MSGKTKDFTFPPITTCLSIKEKIIENWPEGNILKCVNENGRKKKQSLLIV